MNASKLAFKAILAFLGIMLLVYFSGGFDEQSRQIRPHKNKVSAAEKLANAAIPVYTYESVRKGGYTSLYRYNKQELAAISAYIRKVAERVARKPACKTVFNADLSTRFKHTKPQDWVFYVQCMPLHRSNKYYYKKHELD